MNKELLQEASIAIVNNLKVFYGEHCLTNLVAKGQRSSILITFDLEDKATNEDTDTASITDRIQKDLAETHGITLIHWSIESVRSQIKDGPISYWYQIRLYEVKLG